MAEKENTSTPGQIRYRVSTNQKSLATKLVRQTGTLQELKSADKALFIALEDLNDKDMEKLKALLDSLDYEPIFIAHSAATCD